MDEGYSLFWSEFRQRFPGEYADVWYEVFVDFWVDYFSDDLTIEENLQNAYDYLNEHQHDYD